MDNVIKFLVVVMLITQIFVMYWIYETEKGNRLYRSLEESDKKNNTLLIGSLQKKIANLEARIRALESSMTSAE